MPQDPPPIPTQYESSQSETTSFKARLLQVGDCLPANGDQGLQGLKLVEQLYPLETQIYQRAVNELAERLTDNGSTPAQVADAVAESRRLLSFTLIPFIDHYIRTCPGPADSSDIEAFRLFAKPWASAQLRSCARYITVLVIHDYVRQLADGLIANIEERRIAELTALVDEHGHRPEAQPLVDKARTELRRLYQAVADRPTVEPVNPRALSYLLSCHRAGFLRDNAVAAIVLKGNSSAAAEAVANPLQILDVADVATLLDMRKESVTSTVSKIRAKATKWDQIDNSPYELDPRHLWVYLEPTDSPGLMAGGSEGE